MAAETLSELTDRQLLERSLAARDKAAFSPREKYSFRRDRPAERSSSASQSIVN
jgi:hypothetical protein